MTTLTPAELSAEFHRAAVELHQAHVDVKAGSATRLLAIQKFATTPCYDTETP